MPKAPSNLLDYAASPSNPPKGYGSIEKGIEVARYRGEKIAFYQKRGNTYAEAASLAQIDVDRKYGKPE